MTSQGSANNFLEDNNIGTFFDMSLLQQITPDMHLESQLSSLRNDMPDKLKYEEMVKLVKVHMVKIPLMELDLTLLQHLLPSMKNLVLKIVKEVTHIIENLMRKHKLLDMDSLKQCLQMCFNLMDLLSDIISYILANNAIQMIQIKSLPGSVASILSCIFIHCKEKKDAYLSLGETDDVILLFKKAQDINLKLIDLLKVNVIKDITSPMEQSILEEVLYIIGGIGQLLLNINLKASSDNWIGYLNISQKFQDYLSNDFKKEQFQKLSDFFSSEILNNMQKLSNLDNNASKSVQQIQKVIVLLTKFLNKFIELNGSQMMDDEIAMFIIKLFNYYKPSNAIDSSISDVSKEFEFFSCLVVDVKVCEKLISQSISTNDYGFLLINVMFFRSLINSKWKQSNFKLLKHIDLMFRCFENNALEMFYKNDLNAFSSQIYDDIALNVALSVHMYGATEYEVIEQYLFAKLTNDVFVISLLALDILLSILRMSPVSLQFDTLCGIAKSNAITLKSNNVTLPKVVMLRTFMKKLFLLLREDYKLHVVQTYPILENLHLWRYLGLYGLPNCTIHMINSLVSQCISYMKKFLNSDMDTATFVKMCQMWETLSTVEIINMHVKELYAPLIELWETHNWNEDVQCYTFYNYYLSCLFTVTNRFIASFCNYQIITVLKQIARLMKTDQTNFTCEIALQLLETLCKKIFSPQNQHSVFNLISEILNKLLIVDNAIIKQRSLELLHRYMMCSPHNEIAHKTAYSLDLQKMLANYCDRKCTIDSDLMRDYLRCVLSNSYQHKCKDLLEMPRRAKRTKLQEASNTILDRIEMDSIALYESRKYLTPDDRVRLDAVKSILNNL